MLTATLVDTKNNFSKVTSHINETGDSVTVLKNGRPWVRIEPLACDAEQVANRRARAQVEEMLSDPTSESFDDIQDLFDAMGI